MPRRSRYATLIEHKIQTCRAKGMPISPEDEAEYLAYVRLPAKARRVEDYLARMERLGTPVSPERAAELRAEAR